MRRFSLLLFLIIMFVSGTSVKAQVMQEKVDFNVWPKGELNTA